ncbi:MAG: hypothetical protein DRP45_12290 [Candidatus Zixiibacteriota bacterium]|nr:MAG: hypothetical protein DRP45_12290 [candidate division Zixibacteria bacterium]
MIDMNEEHHVNETGQADGRWQDAFNDDPELANSPVLETFKTQGDALKGLVELKAYQGRSTAMVKPDASAEEKAAFVEKLRNAGVDVTYMPNAEDPDDVARFWHEQGVPKDGAYTLPEGTNLDGLPQEGVDATIKLSTDLGHTAKQHEGFVNAINKYNVEINANNELEATKADENLTKILGDARPALESVVSEAIAKHQHPDMPAEKLTAAQELFVINLIKSISVDPQSFEQINNPNTGPTPAEIRAKQADLFTTLTKHGGRDLGGRRKALQAEYEKTFADLAKFK